MTRAKILVMTQDTNIQEFPDHVLDGNKDQLPGTSSRVTSISFARRVAQSEKSALMVLKYIATHELTGALQPIATSMKSSVYVHLPIGLYVGGSVFFSEKCFFWSNTYIISIT